MNKCPRCLNIFSESVRLCKTCGYSFAEDVKETLSILSDETLATRIFGDESMTPEKWKKVKDIFLATEKIAPDKRQKYLAKKCGDDLELRREIENLLDSDNDDAFLEDTAISEAPSLFDEKTKLTGEQIHRTTSDPTKLVEGTVFAERFRIQGLLGKGGMGEVYKAEDLTLGQTVALKFLPDNLAKNEDALKRFISEVKTARQVSHENVCRVFDIGEVDGNRYLSMEFIEGDDLSKLLNRIGRLPSDKAIEISRQICMGLNAIHKTGILHRDLKPANVIIDEQGRARITDFGIAGYEEDLQGREAKVGTPAYMSPEQVTGSEVTQKSDIYSLGLLLYEIFTGKQAFSGKSMDELLEKQKSTDPTNPSEFVENMDPLVEKIIKRCLEKNPKDRPDSAVQIALALPGGNPLEVALEAGETPSPEMIAAAPIKGTLKPLVALGLLLGFIGMFSFFAYWHSVYSVNSLSSLEKSPDALQERSKTIVNNLGYTDPPLDTNFQIYTSYEFRNYAREQENPREWWEKISRGYPYFFAAYYRQSPDYLIPIDEDGVIDSFDPPFTKPGMVDVYIDTKGRLFEFSAIPPTEVPQTEQTNKTDWKQLFDEAGLDIEKFEKTTPEQIPSVPFDENLQWKGSLAEFPEIPIKVNASALSGKPVYFKITPPWQQNENKIGSSVSSKPGLDILFWIYLIPLLIAFLLAYYNLKNGRGDLSGAIKIGVFCSIVDFAGGILRAGTVPGLDANIVRFFELMGVPMKTLVIVVLVYLAVEPLVRKRWSNILISWNRLVAGDFRDPMIGRDILIGCVFTSSFQVIHFGLRYLGFSLDSTMFFEVIASNLGGMHSSLNGIVGYVGKLLSIFITVFKWAFGILLILLIPSLVIKKKWVSILIASVIVSIPILISGASWLDYASFFISLGLLFVCLIRFGVVAFLSMMFVGTMVGRSAVTFDTGSFYFPTTVLLFTFAFSLAIYAFYISIAGQPIFGKGFLDDG